MTTNSGTYVKLKGFEEAELPETTIGDAVAFERHFDRSAEELGSARRMEHVLFMLWRQARRLPQFADMSFDRFVEDVEEMRDANAEVGPKDPS